jgi:hypothetical protein
LAVAVGFDQGPVCRIALLVIMHATAATSRASHVVDPVVPGSAVGQHQDLGQEHRDELRHFLRVVSGALLAACSAPPVDWASSAK